MRYVYLVKREHEKARFFSNKKEALEEMKFLATSGIATWVDRLPKEFFKNADTDEEREEVFDENFQTLEQIASRNWD